MILFHANAMVGLDMFEYALFYRRCGAYSISRFNSPSLSHSLPPFRSFRNGIHSLMVTIGGYGDSEGEPSETSAYRDAQAALDWVRSTYYIEPQVGWDLTGHHAG